MVKKKMGYALSATALMLGAGMFLPGVIGEASAYSVDTDGYAVPEGETDELRYNDLKKAIDDKYNVRLGDDINYYVAIANEPSISVDHSMILDLNGYTLSTASTSGGTNGNVSITVSGEGSVLTIKDTSEAQNGAIRYDHKGNASPSTVRINAGAKVSLESGAIYAPYGRSGEGIAINTKGAGATFEMTGGKVLSHEDSTHRMNYGVRTNAANSVVKVSGGVISTYGPAIYGATESVIEVTNGAELSNTEGRAIEITSIKASGKIVGVTIPSATIVDAVELKDTTIIGDLDIKSGERILTGVKVGGTTTIANGTITLGSGVELNGVTNINGGQIVIDEGAKLNGGLVYSAAASASLTINEGATVGDLQQTGKLTTSSYTDKDTKEKVTASYNTYGSLIINGGDFDGGFVTVTQAQADEANAIRKEYVKSYNEHSGWPEITYSDIAILPEIASGTFATNPVEYVLNKDKDVYELSESGPYVVDDKAVITAPDKILLEVGKTYDFSGALDETALKYTTLGSDGEILKNDGAVIEALKAGKTSVNLNLHNYKDPVDINVDVIAYEVNNDEAAIHTAIESMPVDEASLDADVLAALKAAASGEVAGYYNVDLKLVDDGGQDVGRLSEVSEPILVTVALPEGLAEVEDGTTRSYAVLRYHDGEGVASIEAIDNGDGTISFRSDKFSTFAVTYNDRASGGDSDAADGESTSASTEVSSVAPETGKMTAAGASAASAGMMAAAAVAVIGVIAGIAMLMRRK